jgi:hypothetical protein
MNVSIKLSNGLGDKFLDLIGFCIICKYLNYNPHIIFSNDAVFPWGTNHYDIRLFDFNDLTGFNGLNEIKFIDSHCNFYINAPNPSMSLSPYKVYSFIKQFIPVSFEIISNDFINSKIKPSHAILSNIPKDIDSAYGIHLRKSDKLHVNENTCNFSHENSLNEFGIIIHHLLEDVTNIIINESNVKFLIVSEDNVWKKEISDIIIDISNKYNKNIKLLEINYENENKYSNYNSVLDMFCLSKCKEILQGVKYSTFSILAALIGNNKLRNYALYTDSYDFCLIHAWSSVVHINNNKNYNLIKHAQIVDRARNIETNITND